LPLHENNEVIRMSQSFGDVGDAARGGDHWGWFLFEGAGLLMLGVLAVVLPWATSFPQPLIFGCLVLLSGSMGLISTFFTRRAPGFVWSLLSAAVGIGAGALLLVLPSDGKLSLDAFLGALALLIGFLLIEGLVSICYALAHRKGLSSRWRWMFVSGLIDISLGAVLLANILYMASAVGVMLGINLSFGGWALIMMALSARPQASASRLAARSM
jgi:uncharacterized membrane protein HdeD (DUF308 family)